MAAVYKVYCTYAKAEDFCNDHAILSWQTEIHKANLANQVSEGEISQPLDYQRLIPRQASLRSTKYIKCALAVRRSNVSVHPCGMSTHVVQCSRYVKASGWVCISEWVREWHISLLCINAYHRQLKQSALAFSKWRSLEVQGFKSYSLKTTEKFFFFSALYFYTIFSRDDQNISGNHILWNSVC